MREILRHCAKSDPHTLDLNNEWYVTDKTEKFAAFV